jgi:adenylate kinase
MRILITGPQGSGKTTQMRLLASHLEVCGIDPGELIRDKSHEDSAVGRTIKSALEKGEMVPNDIAADILKTALVNCPDGFITDGYPRNISQLEVFDPEFDKVFYLKITDEESVERLRLRGRVDDTPELIKKRLELYHSRTQPVLEYYKKQAKLVEIDGMLPLEQVNQKIMEHIQ